MTTIRTWLAILAAAAVPLAYYLTQRRERRSGVAGLVETAKDKAGDAAAGLRSRFSDEAGAVAATDVKAKAGALFAAAPRLVARIRTEREESGDWRTYPAQIGR
jgi:hypothetical protein